MQAIMLLCDQAQVSDDKLYILGGGHKLLAPQSPLSLALAVLVEVPWTAANEQHELALRLIDDDGAQLRRHGMPVQTHEHFEVGRPPGTKPGAALSRPFVFEFHGLLLPPGGYVFELRAGDALLARTPFRVGASRSGDRD